MAKSTILNSVEEVIEDFRNGRIVIVVLIAGRMRSFNALSLPAYQSVSSNAESLVAL